MHYATITTRWEIGLWKKFYNSIIMYILLYYYIINDMIVFLEWSENLRNRFNACNTKVTGVMIYTKFCQFHLTCAAKMLYCALAKDTTTTTMAWQAMANLLQWHNHEIFGGGNLKPCEMISALKKSKYIDLLNDRLMYCMLLVWHDKLGSLPIYTRQTQISR